MDDQDSKVVDAFQSSKLSEEARDLRCRVLVDALDANKRIENEETGPDVLDSSDKALEIILDIKAKDGRRKQEKIEIVKRNPTMITQAGDTLEGTFGGVLGKKEEHRSRVGNREGVEAWCGRRHTDGDIESHPGFTAFRMAAKDTDTGGSPQGLDEPLWTNEVRR
jgi:hypothetical protein